MKPAQPSGTETGAPLRRKGNRLYLAIWGLLGFFAASYLVLVALGQPLPQNVVFWAPDAQSPSTSMALRQSTDDSIGSTQFSEMTREIAALKSEVSNVTKNLDALGASQQETQDRVARLESWQSVVVRNNGGDTDALQTGAAVSDANEPAVAISSQVRSKNESSEIEGTTLDGVTRTAEPVTEPTNNTTSTEEDAAVLAALLSGDPEAAAAVGILPKPTKAVVKPAATKPADVQISEPIPEAKPIAAVVPIPGRRTFGVELGSGASIDSLRLKWALLNERHRDLIGTLAPRYVRSGSGQSGLYRLIAGPFTSSLRARELCTQLQAYYVNCQTSAFTGQVL